MRTSSQHLANMYAGTCCCLLAAVIAGCSTHVGKRDSSEFGRMIIGTWRQVADDINYPRLHFHDSAFIRPELGPNATFESLADTVYYYNYSIENRDIVLIDIGGNESMFRILKLDHDSLIFDGLPMKEGACRYYRLENPDSE